MKIKIEAEIDCTPEEFKAMWNAPDLKPLQDTIVGAVEEQVRQQLAMWPPTAWAKIWGVNGPTRSGSKTSSS